MVERIEARLVAIELDRAKRVARIRAKVESGHVPTAAERWDTRRGFGILRAEQRRLQSWLESHR